MSFDVAASLRKSTGRAKSDVANKLVSMFSHDGSRCEEGCRTCAYWRLKWPDGDLRREQLVAARARVTEFQQPYQEFVRWSAMVRGTLREKIEVLYRDCQRFATDEIGKLVAEVNLEFAKSDILTPDD